MDGYGNRDRVVRESRKNEIYKKKKIDIEKEKDKKGDKTKRQREERK